MERDSLIRRFFRQATVPAIFASILVYFAYHSVQGERGIAAWLEMRTESHSLQIELSELRHERKELEKRVALLRPESLDPDLLDERARAVLGFSRPDELTVFQDMDR